MGDDLHGLDLDLDASPQSDANALPASGTEVGDGSLVESRWFLWLGGWLGWVGFVMSMSFIDGLSSV